MGSTIENINSVKLWSRSPLQHECYSNRATGQQQSSEPGTEKAGLQKQAREPKPFSSPLHLTAVHRSPSHWVLSSLQLVLLPMAPRPHTQSHATASWGAGSWWAELYSCGIWGLLTFNYWSTGQKVHIICGFSRSGNQACGNLQYKY